LQYSSAILGTLTFFHYKETLLVQLSQFLTLTFCQNGKNPEGVKWDFIFGTRRARPPNGFSRHFFCPKGKVKVKKIILFKLFLLNK
jgi:hypothetical protein